jgi:hypothetical protein
MSERKHFLLEVCDIRDKLRADLAAIEAFLEIAKREHDAVQPANPETTAAPTAENPNAQNP